MYRHRLPVGAQFRSYEVPVCAAMALVLLYYCAFTPLSTLLGSYLADTLHWNEYLVTFLNMVLNLVTEYVYDRLVVYRGAVDTARRPEEQTAEDCQ